jgi:hypothetical protein
MQKQVRVLVMAVVALLAAGTSFAAEYGVQASFADNSIDFGIGGRVIADMDQLADGVRLIGSFDYYFPDGGWHYWELNGNLVYAFHLRRSRIEPYAGAGLVLGHRTGNSELGLNLLGGINLPTKSLKPFVEAKVELRDGGPFVIAVGLRF